MISKDLQHYHPNLNMDDSSLNCIPQEIKHIIKKLPSNKAPGPDKITTTALKKLRIKPIVQIYYIFKACLKLFYFPTEWKTAKVILIPKQGKFATTIGSYRPVSLLSIINKLFEKIIITHLLTPVNNSNIIIPQQFGFTKKPFMHPAASYGTHYPRNKQKQSNTTYPPRFKKSL